MKKLMPALVALLLTLACSLTGAPTVTPTAIPATPTAAPPTDRPIPPTAVPPTPTPLSPVISLDTAGRLSTFMSLRQADPVRALAFSPDGSVLASPAAEAMEFAIQLWELGSGSLLRTLHGNVAIVWDVAFSPDGQLLAAASSDRSARVWDWRAGSLLESLPLPNEVASVTFSPDGQTLAAGGVDEWPIAAVWTYAVGTWQQQTRLEATWNIPALVYSPDGQSLVGGGTSRNVLVWRMSDGARLFSLYHSGQVTSLAISPDGTTIAAGLCDATDVNQQCTRGAIWLWDLRGGTRIDQLPDFPDWVEAVAYSADGSVLIGGSRDGTLRFYATSDLRPVFVAQSPGGIGALAVSADGRLLASGGGSGEIHVWRVEP